MAKNINSALIKLFKSAICSIVDNQVSTDRAFKSGIVFVKNGKLMSKAGSNIVDSAIQHYGISERAFGNTFFKDYSKVNEENAVNMIKQQLIHYISTYGLHLNNDPYIPASNIQFKNSVDSDFKFLIINCITEEEAKDLTRSYFKTLRTPNKNLMEHILTLIEYFKNDLTEDDFVSFELKCVLYKEKHILPTNAVDILRYLMYLTIDSTLLIKNVETIEKIKYDVCFANLPYYFSHIDLKVLASIFYRYKPIFLAMKHDPRNAPYINKIRKLAKKYHKPLPFNCIQNYFQISDKEARINILKNASNFELIKLLNFVSHKIEYNNGKIGYIIRNGKIHMDEYISSIKNSDDFKNEILKEMFETDRFLHLKDKKFYIPSFINYAAPVSGKQMSNTIPYGSYISIKDNAVIGIHWENIDEDKNIDLDLHAVGINQSFGWNSNFYSQNNEVKYSGDMTSAPKPYGASEAFLIKAKYQYDLLFNVSIYSTSGASTFQMFIAESKKLADGKQIINFGKRICEPFTFNYDIKDNIPLGIFSKGKFYFFSGYCGKSRVISDTCKTLAAAMLPKLKTQISLETILSNAGATIYHDEDIAKLEKNNAVPDDIISLAPQDLDNNTLLELIQQ